MKKHLKYHAKKHALFYAVGLTFLVLIAAGVYANYRGLVAERRSFYTATLEKQSLSELNLYSEGSSALAKQYFTETLNNVNQLADDKMVQAELSSGNYTALKNHLADLRANTTYFDSFTVITAKGKMAAISSNGGDVPAGYDETQSPAYKLGVTVKTASFIPLHYSQLGRNVFSIVAPMYNDSGTLVGVAAGAITMQTLAQHIVLSSQYDTHFQSLLTDSEGNSMVWANQPVLNKIQNNKTTEPTLASLLAGQTTVPANEEYNFMQQNSFAQGNTLDFGNGNKLFMVSFYDTGDYQQRINEAVQSINTTFAHFLIRDAILFAVAMIIVGVILRRHGRHTTKA